MNSFDVCIIGQGIAGTTLAWQLHWNGQRVAIVDPHKPVTASRIAAGLMTPITGQRLVKHARYHEDYNFAVGFHRKVERETNSSFLHEKAALRLFVSHEERQLFEEKATRDFAGSVKRVNSLDGHTALNMRHGGFEMSPAGRLNVSRYLDVSRQFFEQRQTFFQAEIDLPDDLSLSETSVAIPKLELEADRLVFCQGFASIDNPWFGAIPFDAAKGEILTVRIPGLKSRQVVHRGVWLAPCKEDLFRVGATYDRAHFNETPTPAGRAELCRRLENLLRVPYEIVDHRAAVRPIIQGKQPRMGFHPERKRLGILNGLGSKGALMAPRLAARFVEALMGKSDWPAEYDVAQCEKFSSCPD
ncbi:MAG: FAD-dependent oxidoreductase [Planctomycetaceae bacterium]